MKRTRTSVVMFVLLAALTAAPLPASGEWFADLYAGVAITQEEDFVTTDVPTGITLTSRDVEFDTSVTFGGRVGYWFETPPFRGTNLNIGVAVDVFHFQPDIDSQTVPGTFLGSPVTVIVDPTDVSVTGISFDLMLRWPSLVSAAFPKGQLQPYLTVGPTIFIADAEDTTNFDPPNQSETDVAVGVKAGAGLAWHIATNVVLFGEYRFTFFSPEFEFTDVGDPTTLETDAFSHHFVAGIGYRF